MRQDAHALHCAAQEARISRPTSPSASKFPSICGCLFLATSYSKIARFSLDGNHLELVSSGLNNIWGFQLRGNGEWYLTEANDMGHSVNPAEPGTGFKGIGNEKIRPYQPLMPVLHKFRVGGTGISGLAFSDDVSGGFPDEWRDVAILANPITSTINCVKIVRNPDGTVTAQHLPDLLTSTDDWFRPVNIEFGPDGCLYIADWYNKIVSHNELPTTHPDRDKSHGRIWRIRPQGQPARVVPNLHEVATGKLAEHLKSPFLWEKRAAWQQISDRPPAETEVLVPALLTLAADDSRESTTRIHALWSLESLEFYDGPLMASLLASEDDALQREAIRSLVVLGLTPEQVATKVAVFIDSPNVKLRSQAIRTLDALNAASAESIDVLVSFCRPVLSGNALGGSYERSFERFLARKALEKYPEELKAYLGSEEASKQPATHLAWAMQALGDDAAGAFASLWEQVKDRKLNLPGLIIISKMAKDEKVYEVVLPKFQSSVDAPHLVALALSRVEDTYSPGLAKLLVQPITHLLSSQDPAMKKMAVEAVRKFAPPLNPRLLDPLLKSPLRDSVIEALSRQPEASKSIFVEILDDPKSEPSSWLAALSALSKCDPALSQTYALARLTKVPSEKPALIATLGKTTHGTATLLRLLQTAQITSEDLSFDLVDRMHTIHPKNPEAVALFKSAQDRRASEKKAALDRLPVLIKLVEKSGGNPEVGRALFQGMCLSCHVVGSEGAGIGPALDGSAAREPEALLTAILDPDAAAEGAWVLYRLITKQGDIIEGAQLRSDASGTIVAAIGGVETFVPANQIARGEFAGSRSFMPAGLMANMADEATEHLLAYIKTLK